MTLARRKGTVIVLPTGVYFPMLDLDRPRTLGVVCFQTRAGFAKLTGKRALTQRELRQLFRQHRNTIEKLANALHEASSDGDACALERGWRLPAD